MLIVRDLTAVYKQTLLGPVWFIIQPLITTLVFTVIFGQVANVSTDGIPKLIFYMSGTVLWNYFAGCLTQGANSLETNNHVLSKIYFPRLIIPLSGVVSSLAHFALNLTMFLAFYFYFFFFMKTSMHPHWQLALFPLLVLQVGLLGLAVGLWVAAMTTKYRDLRFALAFLTQLWMYATPIVWPASLVIDPTRRLIVWSNPMSFIIECARWMYTGTGTVTLLSAVISITVTLAMLFSGLIMFNRVQRTFVDTI